MQGDKSKSASWWVCWELFLWLWQFVRSQVSGGSVGTCTRRCATSSHPRTPLVGVCQCTPGRGAEENNLSFFECQTTFWRCWRRMNLWDLTVYFSLMPRFQIWMLTSSLSEERNADTEETRCFYHFHTSKILWNHEYLPLSGILETEELLRQSWSWWTDLPFGKRPVTLNRY